MSRSGSGVHIDPDEMFGKANQTPILRAGIRAAAAAVAARGNRQGGEMSVEETTLANGRYVARVVSKDVDGEHGNEKTPRRRGLRRAVGGR